jgi:hypothetical protein
MLLSHALLRFDLPVIETTWRQELGEPGTARLSLRARADGLCRDSIVGSHVTAPSFTPPHTSTMRVVQRMATPRRPPCGFMS